MGAPSASADDDTPTSTRPQVRIADKNGGNPPDDSAPDPMMARNETFSPIARRKTRAQTFRTVDDFEEYSRPGWHRMLFGTRLGADGMAADGFPLQLARNRASTR